MGAGDFDIADALQELGDPSGWQVPTGYGKSLALCVMDSIWSIGIRYSIVEGVLDRYLKQVGFAGLGASQGCLEGPKTFLAWVDAQGATEPKGEWLADRLVNRNRTSSRGGVLKAAAVVQACELLKDEGVETTADLLENQDRLESLWRSKIPGQKSGISWKYLLMLAGQAGVKPDRMVHRFMRRVGVPLDVSPEAFVEHIIKSVGIQAIDARVVDHRIWLVERSRSRKTASASNPQSKTS